MSHWQLNKRILLGVVLGPETPVDKRMELFYRAQIRTLAIHPRGLFNPYITDLLTLSKVIEFEALML